MATEAEVEQLVSEVTQLAQELTTAKASVEQKFAELEKKINEVKTATGNEVDLTPLKTAIESLKGSVAEVGSVEPKEVTSTTAQTSPSQAAPADLRASV